MPQINQRLVSALTEQLERRDRALASGAARIGWKLGMGERDSIAGEIAVGHLTSDTLLAPGDTFRGEVGASLHADAEAVVELREDVEAGQDTATVSNAIARFGAALEIVDLAELAGEPDSVVAANVFHRAVAFAELPDRRLDDVEVRLVVGGTVRASGCWPHDLPRRIADAARILAAVGERLRAGDRVITGSIVQVSVPRRTDVVAVFGELASIRVKID